jgi:ketosteroid isomerase-like protein
MNITEIAKSFSNGAFEKTYPFIAEDAEWIVVEENHFIGKQAIIENCAQVSAYFTSVTTHFTTINIISAENKVAINGTAEFLKGDKRLSFVSACDVYEFNEQNQIQKITSYCIQAK